MKRNYIDTENSFEEGPNHSFTLRGNSTAFHHMYEYVKLVGHPPLHHLNMKYGRTNADTMYVKFMDGIREQWPEANIGIRRIRDININDVPANIHNVMDKGELFLVEGTKVSAYIYRSGTYHIGIELFVGSDDEYEKMTEIMDSVSLSYQRTDNVFKDKFYMITHDGQSLELMEYTINKTQFEEFNIDLMHNDDFKPVAEKISTELSKKDGTTGIVLLHGIYGSGKTSYLRHLISTVPKRIIYMPPDLAAQLGTPSFFNFIRGYPNSILIIEDAENILRKRIEGGSAAISNILNMTSGIMGDALNIQVVCTFNADLEEIDEALLRPGRLIANHFFDVLKKDKTIALVKHVHGEEAVPTKEEMTVAEIYSMMEVQHNAESQKSKKKKTGIGFTAKLS